MQILVQTALTVGLFWTILKLTPKSTLLSFTILYLLVIFIIKSLEKLTLNSGAVIVPFRDPGLNSFHRYNHS